MNNKITSFEEASRKLQWAKSAFQIWVDDQEFLLELKFALEDKYRFLIPMLKAPKIETKDTVEENLLHVIFENHDSDGGEIAVFYSRIEEIVEEIQKSIDENLKDRVN